MNYQYINGTDTVSEGFRKTNENFQSVPDTTEVLEKANKYADTKMSEAVEESKEYTNATVFNPNLLINSGFDVWQRGESFATNSGYIADRWKIANSGTVTDITHNTVDGGVHFQYSSANYINCVQFIENIYGAQKVTISAMVKCTQGVELQLLIGRTSNINDILAKQTFVATGDWQFISFTGTLTNDDIVWVNVSARAGCVNFYIKWVKLELGSIATQYLPLSYYDELLKCKSYFQLFGIGKWLKANKTNDGYIAGNFDVDMRKIPTVTLVKKSVVFWGMGSDSNVTITDLQFSSGSSKITYSGIIFGYLKSTLSNNLVAKSMYSCGENILALDAEIY